MLASFSLPSFSPSTNPQIVKQKAAPFGAALLIET